MPSDPDLVTAPAELIITPGNLASHCRIDTGEDDAYLLELIAGAQQEAEDYTWRKFVTQTWDQYFDGFENPLYLRFPPLDTVASTAVTYTDANGDEQTLANTVWEQGEKHGIGIVRLKYNQSWPSTRSHADVVTVQFSCGYGDPEDVPEQIKQAIRVHAAFYYRNREGQPRPDAFERLLSPYRANKFVTA